MLRELRKKRADCIDFVKALNAKKSLTEDENKELEVRWNEAKTLEKRIGILEETEKLSLKKEPIVPPKEKRQYSLVRAFNLIKDRSLGGYELEVHRELEKRGRRSRYESLHGQSLLIPTEELLAPPPSNKKLEKRVVNVPNAPLIDDPSRQDLRVRALYERTIGEKLGIKFISAEGNYRIPVETAVTANWFSGTGGSTANDKISSSDTAFSSLSVVPHYLGSMTGWSLAVLKESAGSINLEQVLRENLTQALAEQLDDSIINADNTGPKPQGLNTWLGTTNLTDKTESTSSKWNYSDFTNEIKLLRDAYKNNMMSPMWLMGTKDEKLLREVQRFASSDGESILDSIGGFLVSGHVPATRLWLGDFSQFQVTIFDSAEISLGRMNNDLETQTTRLVGVLCSDFTGLRKSAFRGFNVTRG